MKHANGTMNILYKLSYDDIEAVVGSKIADNIILTQEGKMNITSCGGDVYGKIIK